MPPKKGRLPEQQVEDLAAWVRMGLPWPQEAPGSTRDAKRGFEITSQDRGYWAFQPIHRLTPPATREPGWIANGIDAFIAAELEISGAFGLTRELAAAS